MHVAPARCGCRALAGSKVQSPVRVEESAPQVHAAAKRRAGRRVKCWATVRRIREPSDGDDEGEDGRELASSPSARRRYLLQYVTDVQPSVMESFSTQASPEVLDAMRHTVTNLVGSLPPQVRRVGDCIKWEVGGLTVFARRPAVVRRHCVFTEREPGAVAVLNAHDGVRVSQPGTQTRVEADAAATRRRSDHKQDAAIHDPRAPPAAFPATRRLGYGCAPTVKHE